jgi:hypothetical protein
MTFGLVEFGVFSSIGSIPAKINVFGIAVLKSTRVFCARAVELG